MHCVSDIPDWTVVESAGLDAYNFTTFQPLSPVEREKMELCSPIRYVANVVTPTLLCIGAKDRRVPPSQGIQYYHMLKAKGCVAEIRVYPQMTVPSISRHRRQINLYPSKLGWIHTWFKVEIVFVLLLLCNLEVNIKSNRWLIPIIYTKFCHLRLFSFRFTSMHV